MLPERNNDDWGVSLPFHIAFSVGSKERVDELTRLLHADGYRVVSGPRTTGDGYYESCIVAIEENQIGLTVLAPNMPSLLNEPFGKEAGRHLLPFGFASTRKCPR